MYNLAALCTILPHWGLEGGGVGPETSHVHKITYGPLIDAALYVMILTWTNPLLRPLEGLGHESLNFFGPKQLSKTQLQKSHATVPLKLFYQKITVY